MESIELSISENKPQKKLLASKTGKKALAFGLINILLAILTICIFELDPYGGLGWVYWFIDRNITWLAIGILILHFLLTVYTLMYGFKGQKESPPSKFSTTAITLGKIELLVLSFLLFYFLSWILLLSGLLTL